MGLEENYQVEGLYTYFEHTQSLIFLSEQFLQNDVKSVSNSQLGDGDSDTDDDTADNVFMAAGEEGLEDKER